MKYCTITVLVDNDELDRVFDLEIEGIPVADMIQAGETKPGIKSVIAALEKWAN